MSPWSRLYRWLVPAPQDGLSQLHAIANPGSGPATDSLPAEVPASPLERFARRMDSILNLQSGLGSPGDKGATGRPDVSIQPLSRAERDSLWQNNSYANRHAGQLPREATRKGWKVVDGTRKVDVMKAENRRLRIFDRFREASTWGRKDGRCILLIVCDEVMPVGVDAAGLLRTPLRPENLLRVRALQVFDEIEAQPQGVVNDVRSPWYRQPASWTISPVGGGTLGQVHHTRVLVFSGNPLPPSSRAGRNYTDDSILQLSWDAVRHRTELGIAGAAMAQTLSQSVMTFNDAKDISTGAEHLTAGIRMRMIAIGKSIANMIFLTGQESYQEVGRNVAGFNDLATASNEALSAAQGEPQTRLLGTAPGGLNTDGENQRGIWAQTVSQYFAEHLRPQAEYLYHLLFRAAEGPTRGVEPESWEVELLPLDELTAQGVANLRKTHAETDAILVQSQIVPAEHIAKSRYSAEGYSDDLLPFDPEAEDAALMAAAQANLAAAEAMPGTPATPAEVAPPVAAPGAPADQGQDAAELLTDEAVSTLATTMTEHGISRCEHGANNRCRICGIERIRGLALDEKGAPQRTADGEPVWSVAWRPIARVGVIASTPGVG